MIETLNFRNGSFQIAVAGNGFQSRYPATKRFQFRKRLFISLQEKTSETRGFVLFEKFCLSLQQFSDSDAK